MMPFSHICFSEEQCDDFPAKGMWIIANHESYVIASINVILLSRYIMNGTQTIVTDQLLDIKIRYDLKQRSD